MNEAEFQKRVTDLCDHLHLKWHHETDSRRSKAGFPDLVIVGPKAVVFLELKAPRGRISKAQHEWLTALASAGVVTWVARPANWSALETSLRRLAKG